MVGGQMLDLAGEGPVWPGNQRAGWDVRGGCSRWKTGALFALRCMCRGALPWPVPQKPPPISGDQTIMARRLGGTFQIADELARTSRGDAAALGKGAGPRAGTQALGQEKPSSTKARHRRRKQRVRDLLERAGFSGDVRIFRRQRANVDARPRGRALRRRAENERGAAMGRQMNSEERPVRFRKNCRFAVGRRSCITGRAPSFRARALPVAAFFCLKGSPGLVSTRALVGLGRFHVALLVLGHTTMICGGASNTSARRRRASRTMASFLI